MTKEERQDEILRAAGRVFYLNGFEKTKIEDIAKEAGIGKGTVYEYFESKQELFEKMVAFNRELYLTNVQRTLAKGKTFREKFLDLARYQTELVKEHSDIFNAMACSKIMAREMGAQFLEQNIKVEEILKSIIQEAVDQGELRSDIDPDIVSAVMMGTIYHYCSKKVIFYKVQPEEIDYEEVVDTVIRGVRLQ